MKLWVAPMLLGVWSGCGPLVDVTMEANTQQCATTTLEGVDVYNGYGAIDWVKVANSGRRFAFIKATQGNYNKQGTFAANWTNSRAANVVRSAYHFFDPTIDGVTQANWFLAEVQGAGGFDANDLPPMLDIECPISASQATSTASGGSCEYAGNSGWVATATMQTRIFDWLDTVERATGRRPIIYSYPSWFPDLMFTDARLANYPLFIATYATCASVPPPWTTAVFWQYSASGTVPGITPKSDVDRFFGGEPELAAFIASTTDVPDGGAPDLAPLPDLAGPVAVDAGSDGGDDGGTAGKGHPGCQCQLIGRGSPGPPGSLVLWLLGLLGLVAWRASGRRKAR